MTTLPAAISGNTSATNVGTYTVTATGKSPYSGSVSATWKISPRPIGECDDIIVASAGKYTGGAITPAVTVKIGNTDVSSNISGKVYSNNVNAGTNTASVTVSGKDNLSGSYTKYFTIDPRPLSEVSLGDYTSCNYTGSSGHKRCSDGGKSVTCYYNTHNNHQRTQALKYGSNTLNSNDYYYLFDASAYLEWRVYI